MTRRRTRKHERWPPPKTKLIAMIKEAVVDAYTESEQHTGFYTLLDERLATPFDTEILGASVTVERIDMTGNEQLVAICRRGNLLAPATFVIGNEAIRAAGRAVTAQALSGPSIQWSSSSCPLSRP